jgi:plastocyanin
LIANESVGGFDISWTMSTANIGHLVGRAEGDGWAANMTQDVQPGFLQYGPYYAGLEPGDHIATWSFMIDNNTADNAQQMRLEVVDADNNGAVISSRTITRKQWKQPGRYEYFSVPFRLDPALKGHRLEFRAYWYRGAYIRQGKVGLS